MIDTNELKTISQITDLSGMIEMLKSNPEIVTSVATALGLGSAPAASAEDFESTYSRKDDFFNMAEPF